MTTLDLAASSDAHEDSTGNNFSDSATVVTCTAHTAPATPNRVYYGGFEFVLTAEIPAGATINAAYITVQANALAADDPNVDIAAEDSADAPDFVTNADVTSRTRTAASVQWTATGIGTSPVNSPSIASVIQELVDDNGGLANGAGIVIFMDGRSDALSTFAVVSLEGTGAPAALHIEFTAAGGGTPIGLNSETDAPLAMTAEKSKATGLPAETDTPLPLVAEKSKAAGLVSETDTPLAMTRVKSKALGLITETDVVLPVTAGGETAVGIVTETDTPLGLTRVKSKAIGIVEETAVPLGLAAQKSRVLGMVQETAVVLGFTSTKTVFLGFVSETGTALALTVPGTGSVVRYVTIDGEFETAVALAGEYETAVSLAGEFAPAITLEGEL